MTPSDRTPIHQVFHFGDADVDPVKAFTQYLIRNPQYARLRHADCEVHLYVVARPVADRLACPSSYISKVSTTIGAMRAAASRITGEDFNLPPPTPAQVAARKAKKAAKKAKQAAKRGPASPEA